MADMYTKVQSSRAFLYSCADAFDAQKRSNKDSASIFLHASRSGVEVALDCM